MPLGNTDEYVADASSCVSVYVDRGTGADAATTAYQDARIDGLKTSLAVLAVVVLLALFTAQRIPRRPPGSEEPRAGPGATSPAATG